MITDKQGYNGQRITTWGRDLEGDLWVGPERQPKWVCRCRCGKEVKGTGFGTVTAVLRMKWVELEDELFCSLACAAQYRQLAYDNLLARAKLTVNDVVKLAEARGELLFLKRLV